MLNFLARIMGLIVVGIFFLALGFFVLSSYMGLDFSERLHLPETPKVEASDMSIKKAVKMTEDDYRMLEGSDIKLGKDYQAGGLSGNAGSGSSYEILNSISLSQLANLIKTGDTVLVLLDNSVLDSPMYNSQEVVMTEVISVDSKAVETKEYGMYINSRYIYPINDFVEAFMSAGQVAVAL